MFIFACVPSFAQKKGGKRSAADTFRIADQLIAKKKYRKAARLYSAYSHNHPHDMNALWKLAQVKLWLNNNRQSYEAYGAALKLDPKNDNLNLNYIHSLLDMGKLGEAGSRLTDMELAGKDFPNMALLRAKLSYYRGDYKAAAAYIKKNLNAEPGNAESMDLNDQIEFVRSPLVSLNMAYLTDNQPLSAVISTLKAEKYFNKYATVYLLFDDYHFTENKISDAPWVRVGNKMYFPDAGLHMNVSAGIMKYPVKQEVGWSGSLSLNKKISAQFDGDLSLDHVPYLDTKTSVDSNISSTRFAAMLNWHMRSWSAQAAFLNSTYEDGNNVYGAYAWVLAPLVQFKTGKLLGGYSVSYSNSTESSFKPVLSLSEIVAGYNTHPGIDGLYNPYFTPKDLIINSVLLSLNLNPSKMVSINLGGDIGYGSINNPYLFLGTDNKGNNYVGNGFSTEYFVPANATAAINFHLDKTWLLTTRYVYHNTYFFSSHYVSLGLQKNFIPRKRNRAEGTASTFSRLIKDIEDDIQALYGCKNTNELKGSVAKVRSKLVTLRDTEKKRKDLSEVLPGSDEAAALQDHYDALNDMIAELDDVSLDDYSAGSGTKKKWLVDKLYQLTSIHYNGSTRE